MHSNLLRGLWCTRAQSTVLGRSLSISCSSAMPFDKSRNTSSTGVSMPNPRIHARYANKKVSDPPKQEHDLVNALSSSLSLAPAAAVRR
jgi:hypothetical protein